MNIYNISEMQRKQIKPKISKEFYSIYENIIKKNITERDP